MKKIIKFISTAILMSTFGISAAFTQTQGLYYEKGYITSVKADNLSIKCFLELSDQPYNGKLIQGGAWICGNDHNIIMDLAKTSKLYGLPVTVTFEGNGAQYKPVYAIEMGKDVQ